jgi:CHAD domain-containing protein
MAIHIEQEIKLQAPRRFDLAALAEGVNGYTASPVTAHKLSTVYYDTEDLRLTRWGCSLRFRRGQGWTLKLPGSNSNGASVRVEHTFAGTGTKPPPKALELVSAFLRGKTVKPVAKLRTTRKSVQLHGATGEEVAEVVDDDVRVVSDGRVTDRFREIEIELQNGAPASTLDVVRRCLQDAGAGTVDQTPKSIRAIGAAALAPPELHCDRPNAQSTAAEVVRHSLTTSVETLLRCDAPLRLAMDAETVHQARVATRKLRSDLRTYMPLLHEGWARSLRDKIKWLADELGAVRDADVLVARLRGRAKRLPAGDAIAAEAVIERFAQESNDAREGLTKILHEKRYVDLLDELVAAAAEPRLAPQAADPAIEALPPLVERRWKKLSKAVDKLQDSADDNLLHQVRINAKKCRYAAEAVIPVGGKLVAKFSRRVENLQKILGDLHDAVCAEQRLREIKDGHDLVFAAGALASMEALTADEARTTWKKAWKKASKKPLRSWM